MSIEYTWNFGPITVHNNINGLNDVVINVTWSCTAKDTETLVESSEFGFTELPEPNPNSFVQMENLNKSVILSWLGDKRQAVEALCAENVNRLNASNTRVITLELNE